MHNIGCKLLMINGFLLMLLGFYAVFFNNTPFFYIINWLMDPLFWGNEPLSKGTVNFKIFTWDLLGMFHIIWGVNLFFIVKYGLMTKKEVWAWRCIVIQVVTWLFVIAYFTLSIGQNTYYPVTIFFAALFIIPLIMTKDVLKKRETGNNP
jgi:hypothetical protein